jgi:predicted Zn-dependent peptidase
VETCEKWYYYSTEDKGDMMIRNVNIKHIHKRLNLYCIQTEKFKTDLMGVYIKRPLSGQEVAYNTLISRILARGTQKYPTTKKLQSVLDASYGMILVSDVVKQGSYHILQFRLQFPNERYIRDKGIFEKGLDIMREVIFNPLVTDGAFDQGFFKQEKANLIDELTSRENDKMTYALDRCIEHMFDDGYGEYVYGSIESLEAVDPKALYDHYLKIIHDSLFDVCIMGDLQEKAVEDLVQEYIDIDENQFLDYQVKERHHRVEQVRYREDVLPSKDGRLVMGFRTHIHQEDALYEASVLAYHILGGGANSELFNLLREEKSLCYYVYAKADKYKGAMFVGVGIDQKNKDQVVSDVLETIDRLSVTPVSQDLLKEAQKQMLASIHSLSDFPNSFMNYLYGEVLGKKEVHELDIDDIIEKYKQVTLEDLTQVYKKLSLDMVYFMHGGDHDIS